jgi:hypothetical protein
VPPVHLVHLLYLKEIYKYLEKSNDLILEVDQKATNILLIPEQII